MDRQFVRIRSWHVVRFVNPTREDAYATMCGRHVSADADVVDTLPAGKSCESCLRLVARQTDTSATNDPVPDEDTP